MTQSTSITLCPPGKSLVFAACLLLCGALSPLSSQTVVNGGRVMLGSWDASGATHTLPSKRGAIAQLPATCTQGEEYFATDAGPGLNKFYCTAANTWTQQAGGSFLQNGTGAVSRTVTAKLQDIVHVKDFGAKGDGVTDDYGAFAAALASGAGEVRADAGTYFIGSMITLAKGQKLYFGAGTHTVSGIRFTDSTSDQSGTGKIECAGSGQTTLLLKNGANRDVISQLNFISLTGSNSKYGLFRGEIRGCTIDGNKSHQTAASYGIRLYGHGLVFADVTVRNAWSDGIYTEWGIDSTFATPLDDLEGYFSQIRSAFNNGNGWTFRGPHDSDFVDLVLYQNGGWGLAVQTSGAYNGNGHLANVSTFMNALGGIYSNSSLDGSQITATSSAGWGMLIDSGAGSHNFSAAQFAGPVGLEVRAPSQIISGNIVNTTTAGLRLNGGSGNFNLQMFNNTGYQVDFSNEVGPSVIFANSATQAPGTLFNGTPGQADFVFLDFGGAAANRYISFPVQTVHVAGWSPQFPQSNAVMAVINDSAQTGNLYASNVTLSSSAKMGASPFANLGSPADGSLLYCSDCLQSNPCAAGGAGALASRVNGAWQCGASDSNVLDATAMTLTDEFLPSRTASGQVGALGWSLAQLGTSYSCAYDPGAANHPGVFRCGSGTTAGDGASVVLTDNSDGAVYPLAGLASNGNWEMQAVVMTDATTVGNAKFFVGLSDNQAAYHPAGGNSIAVRYDAAGGGCSSGESTTHWVYEVIVGGVKTCVDSGLAVAANTWYKMRIYSSTAGTVNFQINGANSGSMAAAPAAAMTPQFMVLTTGTNAEKLGIDWFALKMRGLSR
jgi:SO2946-like, C-terminal domain/Pectate lyase superfamily protein